MKKLSCLLLVLVMMMGAMALAEDDATVAAQLLEDVKGTYVALFPIITDPAYDQIWLEHCAAVVGDEMAPEVAQALKDACNGTIYGQEAIDAYGDGSNGMQVRLPVHKRRRSDHLRRRDHQRHTGGGDRVLPRVRLRQPPVPGRHDERLFV